MKMNRYSLIFKELRTQKQLPLSFFEKVGIKKSNLSKFERGELMMSFDKICILLSAMDVSLAEYELLINHFNTPFQDAFFIELEKAEFTQNKKRLQKLCEEVDGSSMGLMSLITKSKIAPLSNSEIQKVLKHLNNIPDWSYFELSLLQSILDGVEIKDVQPFFLNIDKKISKYQSVFKYRRKLILIAFHYILILSVKGEQKFAQQILMKVNRIEPEEIDFFVSCLHKLVICFMKYRFENEISGFRECLTVLKQIEDLGGINLRHYYENLTKI